jgi:hypothetical protein
MPDWVGPNPNTRFFDRDECANWTASLIQNGTISPNRDAWLFYKDPSGQTYSGIENMTLSLAGCELLCGPQTFYVDAGPRFMTWILPIVLLLSNIELSPIDKRRFATLFQILGDPVEAIWSLIHKLQTWNRLYEIAREHCQCPRTGSMWIRACRGFVDSLLRIWKRSYHSVRHMPEPVYPDEIPDTWIVATVLAGFEDIVGPEASSDEWFTDMLAKIGPNGHPDRAQHWRRAAFELSDGRTDEFLRTILAISLYILQVTSAFEPDVGGNPPTPPGGVIACALFLSFLVPAALLSNFLGAFTSRRSCLAVLTRLVAATAQPAPPCRDELIVRNSWSDYFHQLQFSGGNYTYRPWKSSSSWVYSHQFAGLMTALWSALPICAGFGGAFPIMTFAVPFGFSCRHVWLVIVFGLWVLSAFLSTILYHYLKSNRRIHWRITLGKDVVIGMGSILIIILSAMGAFNSCSCWGRELVVGAAAVTVPLSTNTQYQFNDKTVFPEIVGTIVGFQFVFCALTVIWNWNGITLMRWSERHRRMLWERLEEDESQRDQQANARLGAPGNHVPFWRRRRYYFLFWK